MENVKVIEICNVCKKPKRVIASFLGVEREFKVLCDCEEKAKQYQEQQDNLTQRRHQAQYNRSIAFVDSRFNNYTFSHDDGQQPRISQAMRRFCDNFDKYKAEGRGLLLWGDPASGKTFFAGCILNELIDKGYRCLATSLPTILSQSFDAKEKENFYRRFVDYDLILIDDLGTERTTESATETLFAFFDMLNLHNKSIIVTTNLPMKVIFSKEYADIRVGRIYSRLSESLFPIEINGISHRFEKAKSTYLSMKDELGL